MPESTQLAIAGPKASDQLAIFLGIEKGMMLETLKVQCFKGKTPDQVSDAQLAAFVSTANVLQVNPLIPGMLYAYPERNGGITPILGPDGVFKKLDEFIASGKLRGYECEVKMVDGKPESATAIIHRAGEQVAAKYTAYFSEWSVTSNPNWQARPRHMIWVRAIKQAARQVIHGLPMDADEYEIAQMQNVTPEAEAPKAERPEPPARKPRGAKAVAEVVVPAEPTPAQEAPKAEPEPAQEAAPVAAPAQTMPKLTLKDGEKFSGVVTVEKSGPLLIGVNGVPTPSVSADVAGDFKGSLYHKGGGVMTDGKAAVPAMWQQGSKLKVALAGLLNLKVRDKVTKEPIPGGVLQVFVESAELVEQDGEMET